MAADPGYEADAAGARAGAQRAVRLLLDNGALTALVVLVAALSLLSGDFLTAENLRNVGVQAAVTAVLAFGVTFVIVTAGIDLSVGSVAALSAIVLAWAATTHGLPVWLAVPLALATGVGCGLVSGALIAFGKLPPFIATLAMLSIARGLSLVVSQGSPVELPDPLSTLGDTLGGWLPVPVLVMLVAGLLTAGVLGRAYTGRAMYAIGGNEEAAHLSGIRVRRHKIVAYVLSGALAAVAGVLLAARLSSAQPQAGDGYELDAIAAVVIGGASLAGGVGKASGTLIGALILAVLRNGLNLLEVSTFWQHVVIGAVIALAVLLDTARRRAGARPAAPGATDGGQGPRHRWLTGAPLRLGVAAVVVAAVVVGAALRDPDPGGGTRVGLSLSTLNNPFFVQLKAGAREEAEAAGVRLQVTDAQNDASQQANHVQNFLSKQMDAIVVNPVDSQAAGPAVKGAVARGVPVVAADRGVTGVPALTLVASDNVGGGRLAARELARRLGGRGTVVVLQGTPGTSAARERGKGFADGIAAYPGIKVVGRQSADFDRAKGLDVTTNLLQSHPGVDGVFAENDEMALGAVKALGARAGTSVEVVGFDGTPEALRAVRGGTLAATVAQQPRELGRLAVRNAIRLARGESPRRTVKVPVKVVAARPR
ncbi:substrate-binding domain-containing protein [Streptomyces sp. AC563]|uniref:ABC transporter permease/substrate-binding protein n=1 Tax=Streptomyces buecherae TaxID=2763006 RepID=UPI00164D0DF0|nr:substrate-binding domain-containing protein [Streptomyces buecherae]MBC3992067.1 substrate-binding domain-containing protein [Streptomyces buecherae]